MSATPPEIADALRDAANRSPMSVHRIKKYVAQLEADNARMRVIADSLAEEWERTKARLRIFEDMHAQNLLGPLHQIDTALKAMHASYETAAQSLNGPK